MDRKERPTFFDVLSLFFILGPLTEFNARVNQPVHYICDQNRRQVNYGEEHIKTDDKHYIPIIYGLYHQPAYSVIHKNLLRQHRSAEKTEECHNNNGGHRDKGVAERMGIDNHFFT
jgi:hypothetical protein